jgi:hypothetical protein
MPAGITGIIRARKPHGKGSQVRSRAPASFSDKLVKSRVQHGTVDGALERLVTVVTKPEDGPCPARRIIRIARQIAPQDGAALVGQLTGKGTIDPDKAILNELPYLRASERARRFRFMGRHENPHIARPTISPRAKQGGRLVRSVTRRGARVAARHIAVFRLREAGNAVSG